MEASNRQLVLYICSHLCAVNKQYWAQQQTRAIQHLQPNTTISITNKFIQEINHYLFRSMSHNYVPKGKQIPKRERHTIF
jgi:hypothetical protein